MKCACGVELSVREQRFWCEGCGKFYFRDHIGDTRPSPDEIGPVMVGEGELKAGDIIRAKEFAYCKYPSNHDYINYIHETFIPASDAILEVCYPYTSNPVLFYDTQNPLNFDTAAYDASRGKARFMVLRAKMGGGGGEWSKSGGVYDPHAYPDVYQVRAQRMDGGSEIIKFTMGNEIKEVELIEHTDDLIIKPTDG